MNVEQENIVGQINLPATTYHAVWSGNTVRIWNGMWIDVQTELGLRGTVNGIVKIDDQGNGVLFY